MAIDTVELSKPGRLAWRNVGIGLGLTIGIVGMVVGNSYIIDKYQPIMSLTAFISGKSKEELKKESLERRVKQFFQEHDLNSDGLVDGKEYIKEYDLNRDGLVDENEYKIVVAREYDKIRF